MSQDIKEFLFRHYDFEAEKVENLEGYGSENYLVTCGEKSFVLKFYDPNQEPNLNELLEAENQLLLQLRASSDGDFPVPQENANGDYIFYSESESKYCRLLTFLPGELFANAEQTPELFFDYGKCVGEMNRKMLGFQHIAAGARIFPWDIRHLEENRKLIPLIKNPADRKLVEYFFMQHCENVEPKANKLRQSVIHGDAHTNNVVVADEKIAGIFDFGDITKTFLINELAIVLTYAMMGKDDPITWANYLIKGYCEELPLEEIEIEVLYFLIASRLCISVCNYEKSKANGLISDYITESGEDSWNLLRTWIKINPREFESRIRQELGFKSTAEIDTKHDLTKRNKHTSKALSLQFKEPIKMVGAAFQYMYDASGKTYLDCYNNIPQVGHCHPRVVEAGQRAMARLNTNTRYLNDVYNDYAENLLAKFPEHLTKVFFVNSGSAASDLAIRLAMTHTKQKGIVVMEHGYHGNTRLGIDTSHYKYNRTGGAGKREAIIEAEIPDTYKGRFQKNDGTAGREFSNAAIEKIEQNELPISAFIAEPIVGCGGQIPLAKDYLNTMYPFIREQGGVCISDEVQTGFGRLGEYFWGFEMQDVVPDIVVMGKPMGNGHPMAAVVTTDEIAESFETGMEFFSSFGGNPVSCAIGQAVLDVLEEEKLSENAKEVGGYLLELFEGLVEKYDVCGDARGEGLFLGLELVTDKESKKPNMELASLIQNKLKEDGIMVGTDGPFVNVVKIKPPICVTRENADELVSKVDRILS